VVEGVEFDPVQRRGGEHDRVGAEGVAEGVAQPGDEPPLAEEVVDGGEPRRLEHPPDVGERLFGEQVALQPEVRVPEWSTSESTRA